MASNEETQEQPESQISAEIGEYLSSQYGVLVKILQCLPAKDLKNASKVCRSWESAAKKILADQTKLMWLCYRWNPPGWSNSPQLATWTAVCEHMYFEPDICLCFISKKCLKQKLKCNCSDVPCPASGRPCLGTHLFPDYVKSFLEPSSRFMLYPVAGVISTEQDLSRTYELDYHESRKKGTLAVSLIFLPKMKGVTTVAFSLSSVQRTTLCQGDGKNVDIVKFLGLPENEVVQAVLIFSGTLVNQHCASVLIGKLQERQKHKIAAGGAIMDERQAFEGIIFCGLNVSAASIILNELVCEKDQVEQEISKLKHCSLPTENTVAFMFACVARGSVWYWNEPNVESNYINKALPTTPVVGFFGSGEMGVTCLPDVSVEARQNSQQFWKFWSRESALKEESESDPEKADGQLPKKRARTTSNFPNINCSYSTSIVLLSFNTAA